MRFRFRSATTRPPRLFSAATKTFSPRPSWRSTAAGLGNLAVAEAKLREALALLALRADGTASPSDEELALYAKGAPKGPTPVSPALEAIAPHVALLLVRRSLVFTLEAFGETEKAEAERRLLPEAWRP